MPQTYFSSKPDAETRFQCRHIFTDGRRCASPCLHHENFCYYHHTTRRPVPPAELRSRRRCQGAFALPTPEDRSAIQHSIGEVLQRIAANQLDPRRAGLLLYGLQIASLNLRTAPATPAEPAQTVTEITLDPTLGPLAPRATIGHDRPKGVVQRLLEEYEEAELEQTKLEQAKLEAANLEQANLEQANLEQANLEAANLEQANLEAANLEQAELTQPADTPTELHDLHASAETHPAPATEPTAAPEPATAPEPTAEPATAPEPAEIEGTRLQPCHNPPPNQRGFSRRVPSAVLKN